MLSPIFYLVAIRRLLLNIRQEKIKNMNFWRINESFNFKKIVVFNDRLYTILLFLWMWVFYLIVVLSTKKLRFSHVRFEIFSDLCIFWRCFELLLMDLIIFLRIVCWDFLRLNRIVWFMINFDLSQQWKILRTLVDAMNNVFCALKFCGVQFLWIDFFTVLKKNWRVTDRRRVRNGFQMVFTVHPWFWQWKTIGNVALNPNHVE